MDLVFESGNVISNPFFSVCIETHNRGKTIYRALESLLNQDFENFECIVVDDCSDDETIAEINRFLFSESYKKQSYYIKVYKNQKHLGGVLNWNSPLVHANGKYIAGLEGDDYYYPGYLKKADKVLSKNSNIGIYGTGSQRALRPIKGLIQAKEYFKYIYQMINVCPPSETIFIRLNKSGESFQYDVINNTYAPELQLLLNISNDGWDAYHSEDTDIYREPSTSLTNMTWKYFDDKFRLIEKYKNHSWLSNKEFRQSFKRQFILAIRRYLVSDFQKKGNAVQIKEGIKKVLSNRNFPNIPVYLFIFNLILVLKKMKFFALYFLVKKTV